MFNLINNFCIVRLNDYYNVFVTKFYMRNNRFNNIHVGESKIRSENIGKIKKETNQTKHKYLQHFTHIYI